MNIIRKKREFFFGPSGSTYKKFSSLNRPNESTFRRLFYSIPFFMEPDSTATETSQGLVRLSTDQDAFDRNTMSADGFSRAVQPHQLPSIRRKDSLKNFIYIEDELSTDYRNGGEGRNVSVSSYELVGDGVDISLDHTQRKITFSLSTINPEDVTSMVDDALQNYMTSTESGSAFVTGDAFSQEKSNLEGQIQGINDLIGAFNNVPSTLGNTISKALITLNNNYTSLNQTATQNTQSITGITQSIGQINESINTINENLFATADFLDRLEYVEQTAIPISSWQTVSNRVGKMYNAFTEHFFSHYPIETTSQDNILI